MISPFPTAFQVLVLAADDNLLPTPALRWWRDKDIYRTEFKDALTEFEDALILVREADRTSVIEELHAISGYLTAKIRRGQVQTEDKLGDYLTEMLLEVWLGDLRYRAEDEVEGRLQGRGPRRATGALSWPRSPRPLMAQKAP